ncbi:MAG: glycosyltransferase family 4 protein [Pyrinomonadaceae bacterium]
MTFAIAFAGVSLYRRWSASVGIFDEPNERSLHSDPTPRGGGMVIAAVCLSGFCAISYMTTGVFAWGYLSGAALIVLVSWLDDVYDIPSVWRLICHAAAAVLLIANAGYLHGIGVPGTSYSIEFGWFGIAITVFWVVWMINAYNFMDGIDGIAGLQAVIAGLGWSAIAAEYRVPGMHLFGLVISAASLGFLLHNWQPARIFMGDVGSAFLGLTFAAFPVLAAARNPASGPDFLFVGVLVLWLFMFDSVITLFSRLVRGRRVWHAHREHLYQKLVISGRSHAAVTTIYGIFTIMIVVSLICITASTGISPFVPLIIMGGVTTALCVWVLGTGVRT